MGSAGSLPILFACLLLVRNPIESEWHQLKTHELAGQMFEDELDLAYAVMDGVEARSRVEGRTTKRFKFKSS